MSTDTSSIITIRVPTKYTPSTSSTSSPSSSSSTTLDGPPLDWLHRTWSVTHSTLDMWQRARNVRITYSPLPPGPGPRPRVLDLVEYEKPGAGGGRGGVKTVEGVDTAVSGSGATGAWDWRGKGVLGFVTSHWEVLGWGERGLEGEEEGGGERWVVTWFAPTLFTKEGVDLYSDRKEGMSPALAGEILAALRGSAAREVAAMVEKDMRQVEIELPWMER